MDRCAHLKDKVAVVTGAAGGIGKAVCRQLAGYGMKLILASRNEAKLHALAEELRAMGAGVCVCAGDLADLAYAQGLVDCAVQHFGGVDVVVNNAGLVHNCGAEEVTPELFDSIMQVNVRAPYFICQRAIPMLKKSECATIINICSVVAHKGYPSQSAYVASKHALLGISKSLANELYQDDIRVHVISPGGVYTDMAAIARPDLSPEGMILPEDIAAVVGFYLEGRKRNAVIDEIEIHRPAKAPFA